MAEITELKGKFVENARISYTSIYKYIIRVPQFISSTPVFQRKVYVELAIPLHRSLSIIQLSLDIDGFDYLQGGLSIIVLGIYMFPCSIAGLVGVFPTCTVLV